MLCTCIRSKYRKPKKPRKDKMGFDKDCKLLKQQVLHLAKLVRQFPGDPIVYGNFISAKKTFKSMVRRSNMETKNKLLDMIADSQERDPKTFWKLVDKLRGVIKIVKIQLTFSHGLITSENYIMIPFVHPLMINSVKVSNHNCQ